jgi:aldehyde:ferredoxin oxidoreductase
MVMECYERGVVTKEDTDGIELTWGNVEAVKAMLSKIAKREGFGNVLAEGTMRAAAIIGGEAPNIGVYFQTGAAPRGHDHRARWVEMLDVGTSPTSTLDSANASTSPAYFGIKPLDDPFSPSEVARVVAEVKGRRALEDSLVICSFACRGSDNKLIVDCLNAVTGWDWNPREVSQFGHMVSNLLRCFNIRHGYNPQKERPSPRYCSTPTYGPAKGKEVLWEEMVAKLYDHMGWDEKTGKPLPVTLSKCGLDRVIKDIWPE